MWRGSAAEYRHERDNEIVCMECGAKRKDCCSDSPGTVRDAHGSRGALAQAEADADRAEDRAHELRMRYEEMRRAVREKWTAAPTTKR